MPDVIRQSDYPAIIKHEGLIKTINERDLQNTDIYVARFATGELYAERNGSSIKTVENENYNVYDRLIAKNDTFYYTVYIPEAYSSYCKSGVSGEKQSGEMRDHAIGNERMSLSSDDQVQVFIEWLDHDGSLQPIA